MCRKCGYIVRISKSLQVRNDMLKQTGRNVRVPTIYMLHPSKFCWHYSRISLVYQSVCSRTIADRFYSDWTGGKNLDGREGTKRDPVHIFFCYLVVLELIWYRTTANQLLYDQKKFCDPVAFESISYHTREKND